MFKLSKKEEVLIQLKDVDDDDNYEEFHAIFYECPNCECESILSSHKFCPSCGKRIKFYKS